MKKMDLFASIRRLFEFRPDEAYTLDEVYQQFHMWKAEARRYRRGEVCVRAGTPAKEVAVVVSGILHVKLYSAIGEDILMNAVRPGEYSGLSLVFAPRLVHPYDIVAAADTEVIVFRAAEVRRKRADPKAQPLFDYLGKMLDDALCEAQAKNVILSGYDIAERLRRYLSFRMQKEKTNVIKIAGTAGDLANYLGVNRCALSRAIGRLKAQGKIDYCRNVFTVRA